MKSISINNGNTWLDISSKSDQDRINQAWDTIVQVMDDDTREYVHSYGTYDDGDNIAFLKDYLDRAPDDLIIG